MTRNNRCDNFREWSLNDIERIVKYRIKREKDRFRKQENLVMNLSLH